MYPELRNFNSQTFQRFFLAISKAPLGSSIDEIKKILRTNYQELKKKVQENQQTKKISIETTHF